MNLHVCPWCETAIGGDVAEWRGLSVDWNTRDVRFAGELVQGITPTGTRFLYALVKAQGGNVRHGRLHSFCGDETDVQNVNVQVYQLRRAIGSLPFCIASSQGKGYRLETSPPHTP